MWGKGTLSRSNPPWWERKTKEMIGGKERSLEEITALKRKERAEFKDERMKKERLERERQLRAEGKVGVIEEEAEDEADGDVGQPKRKRRKGNTKSLTDIKELPVYTEEYLDKEVLQLCPEEALFLLHLDLLQVRTEMSPTQLTFSQFLHLIATTSRPDDPFLVRYIVYYHFRRQRIIVKPGIKFGVDDLLYDQPMLFAHAKYGVHVMGSYQRWSEGAEEKKLVRDSVTGQELNMWQRLIGNVRNKLMLVWVEIPPMTDGAHDWRNVETRKEFEDVLGTYKVREVVNSRMVIAKEMDVKAENNRR